MRRLIILLAFASIISLPGHAQRKEHGKGTILSVGTSTFHEVSVSAVQRIGKRTPLALGLEYLFINDNSSWPSLDKHNFLGMAGVFTDDVALLLKSGVNWADRHGPRFDYGFEMQLTCDNRKKTWPCYGVSFTKYTRLQLKFGIAF